MRPILATLVAVAAVSLALTAPAQTVPPKLEPLPEAPPAPPEIANDPELAPQITTIKRENETIEEYRVHGQLTMIKVTPRHGQPYYLVADANGGFNRRDSLDSGLKVPLWVLFTF
ncbi:MAG TPA: DUF2782 domain-containing protein [Casimicrobiaceae bacterium]|jgi:hypothetical protein|nr:DUF2782 domain-containing protein [Casimicrobiaceae bacterium]